MLATRVAASVLSPPDAVSGSRAAAGGSQMKNGTVLLGRAAVAAACLLAVWLCPSAASDKGEPPAFADPKPDARKPDKKPDVEKPDKPDVKKPPLVGIVKALADDGKSFTLQPAPTKKNEQPDPIEVRIGKGTKITT